ncbi:phosphatase PAP2 family protein [Lentibacillus salicampi]|uniref:Phosphatase PAP2 family protein n=1 Tax=Lentibacillus salicampi TaxID=175306 RepID=A0A4Y9ADN7_9BACI|nr:phosphatase PAP2 family protein [Lentibacillus salicampi]TFJ93535.1 phosphatase PAP2 family protein [Lentibacillus salicampi]
MWHRRNGILLFLLMAVLLTIGVWVFRIISGKILYLDRMTRGLVEQMEDTTVYTFFRWVTEFGSDTFLTPFTILMALFLWRVYRELLPSLVFGLGTLTSHGLNVVIKQLVERERPSILVAANAEGYSFPSGHAMIPMVCYGLLAYFLVKKLTSARAVLAVQLSLALLIFLIGISRYIINVHYLTDVIAGFVFGFIYLAALIYLYEWLQNLKEKSPSQD